MTLLGILAGIAVLLTICMFAVKNPLLGYPSAIFWALTAGQAYVEWQLTSEVIYSIIVMAAGLGMTIFCIMAAFSLREKRDTIIDEEMEQGDGAQSIDSPETPRSQRLHQRAAGRRAKVQEDDEE